MSRRWWNPFDGMEQLSFKPVAGGFLYRAPNPWLVGRARHYLVSAAQKEALAIHHRTMLRRMFWMIILMGALAGPMAAAFMPAHGIAFIGFGAAFGLVIGGVINALLVRKVTPIITGLTPSSERITQRDMFGTQVTVFPRGYVLGFAALSLGLLVMSALRPILDPAGRDLIAVAGIMLFGFATIYWSALYVAKCRRGAA